MGPKNMPLKSEPTASSSLVVGRVEQLTTAPHPLDLRDVVVLPTPPSPTTMSRSSVDDILVCPGRATQRCYCIDFVPHVTLTPDGRETGRQYMCAECKRVLQFRDGQMIVMEAS